MVSKLIHISDLSQIVSPQTGKYTRFYDTRESLYTQIEIKRVKDTETDRRVRGLDIRRFVRCI